ncbi:AAA family ATPase [Actinocatenispora comari]|uniref:ATP-binding protein n=1 Tax=Actinocatenispora comari TaxID=2807577 RepID=A0A8J4AC36_9ACTN|nr:ATP-binding protein [Actinocatenispora comari]GIL26975.1 ATP-binding protein [Actinocatenispora comari]
MTNTVALIQFAGRPGSGKTRLSRDLAGHLGASVLDLDVVKSALLDAGTAWDDAGRTAYQVMFALAEDLLRGGRPVIVDSPSRWEIIPERGQQIAAVVGVPYLMIECRCADKAELGRRLASRPRHRSQMRSLDEPAAEATANWVAEAQGRAVDTTIGPAAGWFVVDTTQPPEECLAQVLAYLPGALAARRIG